MSKTRLYCVQNLEPDPHFLCGEPATLQLGDTGYAWCDKHKVGITDFQARNPEFCVGLKVVKIARTADLPWSIRRCDNCAKPIDGEGHVKHYDSDGHDYEDDLFCDECAVEWGIA